MLAITPMVTGEAVEFVGDGDDDLLVVSVTDTGLLQFEADGNPATTDLGGGVELRVADLPGSTPLITGLAINLGDGIDEVVFARGDLPFSFSSPSIELAVDPSTETTRLETAALTAPEVPGDQLLHFGGTVVVASETTLRAHTVVFAGAVDGGLAADLDQDGKVDGHDLMDLLMKIASPSPDPEFVDGDLNDDGMVNAGDVDRLMHFLGDVTGLTVIADEGVAFAGSVGSEPLQRLLVQGDAHLGLAGQNPPGAISIATIGVQSFGGTVQLLQHAVLSSSSGDITLEGPLDGTTEGEQSLEVRTPATTRFANAVGASVALESITTTPTPNGGPDDRTQIGSTITTTGDQSYHEHVVLTGTTELQSGGGTIIFGDTLDGDHALAVAAGTTVFSAAVGGATPLASLTVNGLGGNTTFIGGAIATLGDQTYNDGVVLTADALLTAANVQFADTVNSDDLLPRALEIDVDGNVTFGGRVGNAAPHPLESLTIHGATSLGITPADPPSIRTVGDQLYDGSVELLEGAVLTSTMAGDIAFHGAISGIHALTVNTGGTTVFGGPATLLANLVTDADGQTRIAGGPIGTNGDQIFNDDVVLTMHTMLVAAGIMFGGTVNSEPGEHWDLEIDTGIDVTFKGRVGELGALRDLNITGATVVNVGASPAVTTQRDQSYGGDLILMDDTHLESAMGDVTFLGTVNGDVPAMHDLSILAAAGMVEFNGAIGDGGSLARLEATGETHIDIPMPPAASITTAGEQVYHSLVMIQSNALLHSDANGDITFESTVIGPGGLTVNTGGTTSFVGAVTGLARMTTDVGGETHLNGGSISTTGDQTYNDAVVLTADTTLDGANITFAGPVDSEPGENWSLSVVAGTAAFQGQVGSFQSLRELEVTGLTVLNITAANSIVTAGNQTFGGNVVLMQDSHLTSATGDIVFQGTVHAEGGNHTLMLAAASGMVEFHDAVGEGGLLGTLDVTGEAHFNTALFPAVTLGTTGSQTYHSPVLLLLPTDIVLESTMAGDIVFESTISGPGALGVNTAGTTSFGGAVASLASLTTDAGGQTELGGGSVSTLGDQIYNDAVVLASDALLTAATVLFAETVNSGTAESQDLEINATGGVTFQGRVGGLAPLDMLIVNGPVVLAITPLDSPSLRTERGQRYNGTIELAQSAVLTSTMGGDVTFQNSVIGPGSLTVNTGGVTTFGDAATDLASLTTDAGGQTHLHGGPIETTDDQTYNDDVVVFEHTILAGGNIAFDEAINSASGTNRDLNVTAAGMVSFGGLVGNSDPLRRLSVAATDALTLANANAGDTGAGIHTTDAISLQSDQAVQVHSLVVIRSDSGDITLDAGTNIAIQADAAIRGHGDVMLQAGADITIDPGTEILAGTAPPPPALPLPELNFIVDADGAGGGAFTATGGTGLLGAPGGVLFRGGDEADLFSISAERLRLGDHHEVAAGGDADTIIWTFASNVDVALDPGTTYVLEGGAGDDAIELTFGENVVVSTAPGTTLTIDGGAGEDRIALDHSADSVSQPPPGRPAETARLAIFQYATGDGRNVHVGGFGTANADLDPADLPPTFVITEMETFELEGSTARDHLQVRGVQSPLSNVIAVANADGGPGEVSVVLQQYARVLPPPQTVIPAEVLSVPRRFVVDGYDCLHLIGGSGDDTIINETGIDIGTAALPSLIEGGEGDDILFGGNGLDVIFAGSGVDVLHGRGGEDYLLADLSITFEGTRGDPLPVAIPGVPLFPDPPNLDPADRIYGGTGLNHLAQSGLDLAVGITGMLLDGGATKDVVSWLRAQIMTLSAPNLEAFLDSAFFGADGRSGLTDAGCLISDFAMNAFGGVVPDPDPDAPPVEDVLAASSEPAMPQGVVGMGVGSGLASASSGSAGLLTDSYAATSDPARARAMDEVWSTAGAKDSANRGMGDWLAFFQSARNRARTRGELLGGAKTNATASVLDALFGDLGRLGLNG